MKTIKIRVLKFSHSSKMVALFLIASALVGLAMSACHETFDEPVKTTTIHVSSQASAEQTTGPTAIANDTYAPYANAEYPNRVYWGDTHLHTSNSLDARIGGVLLDVEDAYRFARGETVISTTGQPARLAVPLDFLVVSDHSDAMGVIDQLFKGNETLMKHEGVPELRESLMLGQDVLKDPSLTEGEAFETFFTVMMGLIGGTYEGPLLDQSVMKSVWERYIETADKYNSPGSFTAMIGYEWTPTNGGDKLHRNVLYRDGANFARQLMPFTAVDSLNPQDLWKWMQRYEDKTGGQVLALAHNGNMSNGEMFPVEINPETGGAIDAEYIRARARWEPLYEVTQIKGDGEAHPYLSPNDEFADFDTWDRANVTLSKLNIPENHQYEYAREALKNGLKMERTLGVNPYKFGMVGSTDSHTGLSTAEENSFFGKIGLMGEPNPDRIGSPIGPTPPGQDPSIMWKQWEFSSSGHAAVWAQENTRESLFDAMKRKEVYATTGPRITLRFFGGFDFDKAEANAPDLAAIGYGKGVPMGGQLHSTQGDNAPTFLVGATKDPRSGNLDRIQVVKGWLDAEGNTHEKIYNVVWGDRHRRELQHDGKLPSVGNTVDLANASWTNTIGDAQLVGYWQDPDFDADLSAVYYLRVLEIPTPRWVAYDAKFYGKQAPKEAHLIHQERAYSSPIWYTP